MQIRPKTYLHLISLWRSLRDAVAPHHGDVSAQTSRLLIYTAIVLMLLLAVLEADVHRGELESLGLLGHDYPIPPVLLAP